MKVEAMFASPLSTCYGERSRHSLKENEWAWEILVGSVRAQGHLCEVR
jgi:hypothetical protein